MLKNKVAIVTGAGQGIGRGIAHSLAKENCKIAVSDINLENAEKVKNELVDLGYEAISVKCDVSSSNDVKNLFEATKSAFGRLDVLVNNAGIFPFSKFSEMNEENWDKVMNVNLKSIFLTSKLASEDMKDGGKIINISSIAAFVGFEGLVHYCATKGAINSLIRPLALELASKGITVNAVAPGAIDTPGASNPTQSKELADKIKQQTVSMIPLSRMGQPEDIANAVVFLASDKASYITGQTIIVDGGFTLR